MQIKLAYGRDGLRITLPDTVDVLTPQFVPCLADENASLREALRNPIESPPLVDLVKPGDHVVIVHTDITLATPNDRILPVLLDELKYRWCGTRGSVSIKRSGHTSFPNRGRIAGDAR